LDAHGVRRPLGRARVGRAVGTARTPERAPTGILRVGDVAPPPVFADASGRRRLRRIAYSAGFVVLLFLLLLRLSQLGGPGAMTVYRSDRAAADPADPVTSGALPAIRRRRTALRWVVLLSALALLGNLLLVEARTRTRGSPRTARRAGPAGPLASRPRSATAVRSSTPPAGGHGRAGHQRARSP
jgi:hypothetical protein